MNKLIAKQEQHLAGASSIGFDYQFYYFVCVALQLKHGQIAGFEVKDDIHIQKNDGTTILYQSKHTTVTNPDGSSAKLTTFDRDLWKTLSTWVGMIKTQPSILSSHSFCLVTNKSAGYNQFLEALTLFKTDKDIDKIIENLNVLKSKTTDEDLKGYLTHILKLAKGKLKQFFLKLSFATGNDDIIKDIKRIIYENIRNSNLVDSVYEKLITNILEAKYLDIKNRKKFEISFDDFNKKFGNCFRVAFENRPLPKRSFTIALPDKLEEQKFIQQLLDIGELKYNSPKIIDYTTQMLQAINQFSYWIDNNFLLHTDLKEFEKNSIRIWKNEFDSKFRQIERKIESSTPMTELEEDIKKLALELFDYIKRHDLTLLENSLGLELSNGHFYSLSDSPEIGWHYDWQKKYKTR